MMGICSIICSCIGCIELCWLGIELCWLGMLVNCSSCIGLCYWPCILLHVQLVICICMLSRLCYWHCWFGRLGTGGGQRRRELCNAALRVVHRRRHRWCRRRSRHKNISCFMCNLHIIILNRVQDSVCDKLGGNC